MSYEFKVHDYVYCPSAGTDVYKLEKHGFDDDRLMVRLTDDLRLPVCKDGRFNVTNDIRMILPATEKNRANLSAAYGVEFEDVPIFDLKYELLTVRRDNPLYCHVSNVMPVPASIKMATAPLMRYNEIHGLFIDVDGGLWRYAELITED